MSEYVCAWRGVLFLAREHGGVVRNTPWLKAYFVRISVARNLEEQQQQLRAWAEKAEAATSAAQQALRDYQQQSIATTASLEVQTSLIAQALLTTSRGLPDSGSVHKHLQCACLSHDLSAQVP